MTPKRILIVGDFGRHALHRSYFNTESKLANGFTRLGDNVILFSERDAAREATPFGTKRFGVGRMRRRFLELVTHYRPHLGVLAHADLLGAETIAEARAAAPGSRWATFTVDALWREGAMRGFAERLTQCDAGFLTTAETWPSLGLPAGRVFFMPNPVDPSIETGRAFESPKAALAADGVFLGTGIDLRLEQLDALKAALPTGYRLLDGGRRPRHGGTTDTRRFSTDFLETLASGGASPILPLDDTTPDRAPYLYASDRIAQVIGQGVVPLTQRWSRFQELYEDGVVAWGDRGELADAMERLWRDDAARRRIGETGWRIARSRTDCATVARFIRQTALDAPRDPVSWPGDPIS
jgi:hypothetical protein